MTTKLTKSITQNYRGTDEAESELNIVVNYNMDDNTVEGIEEVYAFKKIGHTVTDLTAIFAEQFEEQMNSMVDSINWREVYEESLQEEEVCHD